MFLSEWMKVQCQIAIELIDIVYLTYTFIHYYCYTYYSMFQIIGLESTFDLGNSVEIFFLKSQVSCA